MGCKLYDRYGRHGDCANCPYDCDEPNEETSVNEDVDDEETMNDLNVATVTIKMAGFAHIVKDKDELICRVIEAIENYEYFDSKPFDNVSFTVDAKIETEADND